MFKNSKKFLAVLLTLVMIFTLAACKADYEWSTDKLPKPSSRKGSVTADDDGTFSASIECSEKDYQNYIAKCRSSGFNAEEYLSRNEGITYLYNADGSTVYLMYTNGNSYRSGYMTISLLPPITFVNAEWPDNTASAQLPRPKSDLYGQAKGLSGDNIFRIYVGNTPYSDYIDYIKQCKEAGFNDISYDEPTEFEANNGEYGLTLSYAALNVMCVYIFPK